MAIQSFRDLRVWQGAMDLVEELYRLTESLPTKELYGLTSQMRRAAVSVPSNIAEGHTREHLKEYLQFISTSQASLAELYTQVEITCRLKYCSREQATPVFTLITSVGKQLHALRNSLTDKG